jgi:two-component system response regulator (stage 0 sporulation protein F)
MAQPLRALVVDDEPDVQLLFSQRFRREVRQGVVDFRFATSGPEALAILHESDTPDVVLVLSDINMPGMTGIELLRLVKQEFPDLRVLMVTAYDNADLQREALECGAEGYLTKPLDFEELKRDVFQIAA